MMKYNKIERNNLTWLEALCWRLRRGVHKEENFDASPLRLVVVGIGEVCFGFIDLGIKSS